MMLPDNALKSGVTSKYFDDILDAMSQLGDFFMNYFGLFMTIALFCIGLVGVKILVGMITGRGYTKL